MMMIMVLSFYGCTLLWHHTLFFVFLFDSKRSHALLQLRRRRLGLLLGGLLVLLLVLRLGGWRLVLL